MDQLISGKHMSKKSKTANEKNVATDVTFVESLKRQWLAMIDALVDPIMIVSPDFKIIKANRAMAELSNQEVRSIIGKPCYQVFANRRSKCSGCKMVDVAKDNKARDWELAQIREDRFFEVTAQPVFSGEGELEGIVQVYRDRTEARQLQEQLLQTEKLASIGLLAGGVAHEINNPLGGIIIFSQMLMRELPREGNHYTDAEEIFNAAQRCKAIVENLLDFARQKPIAQWAEPEDVNIRDALQTALRFAKVGRHEQNIELIEEWLEVEPHIQADRNKMIQLFLNLIQNAFQAMPDGGSLTIRCESNYGENGEPELNIEISDTGVGIPEKHRNQIFDPFFTTKEPGEGTGLGLAITHSIAKDFGGNITFTSTKGKGTTFCVSFPYPNAQKATA
jgi:two-component system, NtrC family, sensor kinase